MSETVRFQHYDAPNCSTTFVRYTRAEIRASWLPLTDDRKQNKQYIRCRAECEAALRGESSAWTVILFCPQEEAEIYAALFVRHIFAMLECTYYTDGKLAIYFGEGGSGTRPDAVRQRIHTFVAAHQLHQIDEHGPLFAASDAI